MTESKALAKGSSKDNPGRELDALFTRANEGDRRATEKLRQAFDRNPGLWDVVGDVAYQAEASTVSMLAGRNEVVEDAIRRKLKGLKQELAGESPSPLERLLVDRVAACWLLLAHAENKYAEVMKERSVSFDLSEYHQRRCDRAQRRYLAAIKALAQVRRLLVPMVQVNIAERQHIAQVVAPTT